MSKTDKATWVVPEVDRHLLKDYKCSDKATWHEGTCPTTLNKNRRNEFNRGVVRSTFNVLQHDSGLERKALQLDRRALERIRS